MARNGRIKMAQNAITRAGTNLGGATGELARGATVSAMISTQAAIRDLIEAVYHIGRAEESE